MGKVRFISRGVCCVITHTPCGRSKQRSSDARSQRHLPKLSTRFGFGPWRLFPFLPSVPFVRLRHHNRTDSCSADEPDRRYFGRWLFRLPWHLVVRPAVHSATNPRHRSTSACGTTGESRKNKRSRGKAQQKKKTNDGQGKMPKNLVEKFLTILLRRKEC